MDNRIYRGKPLNKNIKTNEDGFIYGYLIKQHDNYYIKPDYTEHLNINEESFIQVLLDSIGQDTGYKLKDGIKLFVGDVVKYKYNSIFDVNNSKCDKEFIKGLVCYDR